MIGQINGIGKMVIKVTPEKIGYSSRGNHKKIYPIYPIHPSILNSPVINLLHIPLKCIYIPDNGVTPFWSTPAGLNKFKI